MMTTFSHRTNTFISNIFMIGLSSLVLLLLALSQQQQQHLLVEASDANLLAKLKQMKIEEQLEGARYADLVQIVHDGKQIKPGDPFPASRFKDIDIQRTQWMVSNNDAQHTLILLDLDRKLRPNSTQASMYNQFTTVNIPGHEIMRGQAIVNMEPPTVPCHPGSKHRILALVYHQAQTIDLSDVIEIAASPGRPQKRENFNLQQFTSRHRLSLVAANAFYALGETNGVCSGATTTFHHESVSSSLVVIAMVIVGAAVVVSSDRRRYIAA